MSIAEMPVWMPYLLEKRKGCDCGISEDAPDHVKKEFEEFVKWQTENPHIAL